MGANTVVFVQIQCNFGQVRWYLGKYSDIWGQIQWYLGQIQRYFGADTMVFEANTVVFGRWSVVIDQRSAVTVIGQNQLLMKNDYCLTDCCCNSALQEMTDTSKKV